MYEMQNNGNSEKRKQFYRRRFNYVAVIIVETYVYSKNVFAFRSLRCFVFYNISVNDFNLNHATVVTDKDIVISKF